MYRGFQLRLTSSRLTSQLSSRSLPTNQVIEELKGYADYGREILEADRITVQKKLNEYLLSDGSLDGTKMQEDWFPQIEADVFISHSHRDEDLAFGLAGWLYENLDLTSFVDSAVWGYFQDLENSLLNAYMECTPRLKRDDLKKFASAHVQMMLSVALTQMIDNTECLFFLNTPSSISIDAPIDGTTPSPWIYSEIAMSRLIRKRPPKRYKRSLRESCQKYFAAQSVRYTLPMDHLTKLDSDSLWDWERKWDGDSFELNDRVTALDSLYELNPLKKR